MATSRLTGRISLSTIFFLVTLAASATPDPIHIIEKSYQAHGGIFGTDSLKIAFKFSNRQRINEGQSFVTEAPFDTYITDDEMWIDKPAQQSVYKTLGTLAGGFTEKHVVSLDHGKGYDVNTELRTYFPISSVPNPRQLMQNFLLKTATLNPDKLTFVEESKVRGKSVYHLRLDTINLFINKVSFLVERIERTNFEAHSAKGKLTIDLLQYKKAGKIMVPQKFVTTKSNLVYGTIVNSYDITDVRTQFTLPPDLFKVPDGYTTSPPSPKDCEISKLADGILLIENVDGPGGAYQVLAAEFSNYLLITEAPLDVNTSRRVLEKLRTLYPNKPVKYLVQSHAHYDHIGGILGYTENHTTIVASTDAARIVGKMKTAFETSTQRTWANPVVESVKDRWTVKDAINECIAINVGPNPHSREIIVTYFPAQKILFQADLLDIELSAIPADAAFLKKIKELNLDIDMIVPAHGPVLQGKELEKLIQ